MNRDKRFLLWMSDAMHEVIKTKAAEEDKSMSQWIREAIGAKASQEPWKAMEKRPMTFPYIEERGRE